MRYSGHACSHRHRSRAQGKAGRRLQPRLARLEPRREDRRGRPRDPGDLSERYRPIAELAGLANEFDAAGPLEVVEDKVGTPSTDFWAISFAPSSTERDDPVDEAALERGITILQACWAFFDGVAGRVSEEMRKGPRGGGRDRTRIVRHVIRNESEEFAKSVGLRIPEEGALEPNALRTYRKDYVAAMRAYNAGQVEKRMKSRSLPFLIRHSAFHTLDHAWEMEDKDLSAEIVP